MVIRTVLVIVAAATVLAAAWLAMSRGRHAERASTPATAAPPAAATPAVTLPPTPLPEGPAAAPIEGVVKTIGENPQEVTLSEGARILFDSALAAQELGASIDLAASVATDPEMRHALLGEASRRLPGARGEERCKLLALLATLGDPQGFALWKSALESDPDPRCREVLARHPMRNEPFGAQAIQAALDRARLDREASVRQAAIEGLPAGLSKERMDVFLHLIAGDAAPAVRRAALAYLSEDARGEERLLAECKRLVADETQVREVRLLASAILRDARPIDPTEPVDPDAKADETDLDRSLPPKGR